MYNINSVKQQDKEMAEFLDGELKRQKDKIELIASENYVSEAVMEAAGCWLTNKYAEGYPEKRYYGGCEEVDKAETLAIERIKKIFGADHANVQPHSGSNANLAVYFALLSPGDTIMGMNLSQGGHLTHGSPVSISGKYFNIVPYGVNKETEMIDYDELESLAKENKPKLIIAGASAYSRSIDFERFSKIAKSVGAYLMVDMAHIAGLVATSHHQNPVPFADVVTSTTHKTLRGPRGGLILCKQELAKKIDSAIFPGIQGGPLMHIIAAKGVSFKEVMEDSFKSYSEQVIKNANALAKSLTEKGMRLVTGGTDNHLMLIDLRNMNITGKKAQIQLDEVGISCNKNTIPFDPESPFVTSGIRIGTPAITTRGLVEKDMVEIAELIYLTLSDYDKNKDEVRARVKKLMDAYPLY